MSGKYGFEKGGIELPSQSAPPSRKPVGKSEMTQAVQAGNTLGFVDREPVIRRKPGPKRKEPQDKVCIPGPKRVTDAFRAFCNEQNVTLWQGLEMLLNQENRPRVE